MIAIKANPSESVSSTSCSPLNSLGSEDEEGQVEEILERLKREVKQRRLLLYSYLRDYDRVSVWFATAVFSYTCVAFSF